MINLENVTLVAVACVRVDRTLKALKYSKKGINFSECLLITNEDIIDDEIKVIKIEKLDYEHYNKFIVYNLFDYIKTDFALIIQDDGFVVNPEMWSNEFLDYDYIGAIWPIPNDNFSYRDSNGKLIRVGNGGFTLRSKKLLGVAKKLNLEWKSYYGYYNEDGFICCHNREYYEKEGCVFAPLEIAKYFSHESIIPETIGITPFGFHGKNSHFNNLISYE
jgi:hypothetical protein